jgi:hypothetical protein
MLYRSSDYRFNDNTGSTIAGQTSVHQQIAPSANNSIAAGGKPQQ